MKSYFSHNMYVYAETHTRILAEGANNPFQQHIKIHSHYDNGKYICQESKPMKQQNFQYSLVHKELNKGIPRACRDVVIKAKAQLKFKVARLAENCKKVFFRYVNKHTRTKGKYRPTERRGELVTNTTEKAEVPKTYTSVFTTDSQNLHLCLYHRHYLQPKPTFLP